jgi:hypothetical protein
MESLDKLISAAEAMLLNGFDLRAFLNWQMLSFGALLTLLGPSNYYTQNFKRLTSEKSARGLLAGEGLLMAVREELVNCVSKHEPNGDASWGRPTYSMPKSNFSTFSDSTVRSLHC